MTSFRYDALIESLRAMHDCGTTSCPNYRPPMIGACICSTTDRRKIRVQDVEALLSRCKEQKDVSLAMYVWSKLAIDSKDAAHLILSSHRLCARLLLREWEQLQSRGHSPSSHALHALLEGLLQSGEPFLAHSVWNTLRA